MGKGGGGWNWNVFEGLTGGGGIGVGEQGGNGHSFQKQDIFLNYFEGPRDFSLRKVVQLSDEDKE